MIKQVRHTVATNVCRLMDHDCPIPKQVAAVSDAANKQLTPLSPETHCAAFNANTPPATLFIHETKACLRPGATSAALERIAMR